MRVYAVIPGLNVAKTVGQVIRETKKYVDRIIFVDDGSRDNSAEVAWKAGAGVMRLSRNCGKGYALRIGFKEALRAKADVVIALDSDGQHYPHFIPYFLRAIKRADVVIGSRYAGNFYTFPRNVIGNFGLNFITNIFAYGPKGLLMHKWKGDTQSGFRAFRREALEKMRLTADRYAIEGEMVYEAGHKRLIVTEIPIETVGKIKGVTVMDGLKNATFLFKKAFRL